MMHVAACGAQGSGVGFLVLGGWGSFEGCCISITEFGGLLLNLGVGAWVSEVGRLGQRCMGIRLLTCPSMRPLICMDMRLPTCTSSSVSSLCCDARPCFPVWGFWVWVFEDLE